MTDTTIQDMAVNDSSYAVARWLLEAVHDTLRALHFTPRAAELVAPVVYTMLVVGVGYAVGWCVRKLLLLMVHIVARHHQGSVLCTLENGGVFSKLSQLISPIVILSLLPFAYHEGSRWLVVMERAALVYMIIAFMLALFSIFDVTWKSYERRNSATRHPLKGLLQLSKGIVLLLALIVIISVILNRSPMVLFTGLGAFAAVLMLVFKDSILGFVAGVQLAQNDMLRVGDWIVVPSTPANGTVIDVSLNVVKVQNWDNTIIMIPPYTLISTSFQNWRGMSDSGLRRIARAFYIDVDSVKPCTPAMLADYATIPLIASFITDKQHQQTNDKEVNEDNASGLVDGTIDTNLGVLRAYLTLYIMSIPSVSHTATLMVQQLTPTIYGIPVQIYCFTSITSWVPYEGLQAEIMEHFAIMIPRFGLRAYQMPATGNVIVAQ